MAAKIISRVFGHTLVDYKSMLTNPYIINDIDEGQYSFSWDWFCESVIEENCWLLDIRSKKEISISTDIFRRQKSISTCVPGSALCLPSITKT